MRNILYVAAVFGLLMASSNAQQRVNDTVEVQQPWARASAGRTGAAYFSLVNKGTAADRLVTIKTPVAEKAELHEDKMENGIMVMRPIGPLAIGPGQQTTLKPGAYHAMLIGLKHPLKQGDSFPLTLSFEKAGDIEVTVRVAGAGAMTAMPEMQGGMEHGGMK